LRKRPPAFPVSLEAPMIASEDGLKRLSMFNAVVNDMPLFSVRKNVNLL
jgi:hypothetical protein